MFLDQVLEVDVTEAAAAPSLANFGTPTGLAYHTHTSNKIDFYFDASDMIGDGYTTFEPGYLIAQQMCDQNPHAASFGIIRGTTAVAQHFTAQVVDHQNGDSVGFSVVGPDGVQHNFFHVNGGSETNSTVATAIGALITTAAIGLTPTVVTDTITCVATATAEMFYIVARTGIAYTDTTPTANVATDLAATRALNTGWYSVTSQYIDATNIAAIANWCETARVINAYVTTDDINFTATSGIGATLKALSLEYSLGFWTGHPGQFSTAALIAQRFTDDPGSDSYAYKTLINVNTDVLSDTQQAALGTNNLNFYIDVDTDTPITWDGRMASGNYADIRRGIDWLRNKIQINELTLLKQLRKLPFTQGGIQALASCTSDALDEGIRIGFISDDDGEKYVVTPPKLKDVTAAQKAGRTCPPIKFTCVATGAIHKAMVKGTVNF